MAKVSLYIYDISKGMARQLSLPFLGKQIDGVWHTSIVCFGREYFYGGDGISNCDPCGTILGPPDETVNLGETGLTKRLFQEYLFGLGKEAFRSEKYHLFRHNCNTFSSEVALFLTGKKIPSYITDLPEEVMSTAFGAMMAQFFDNMVHVQPQSRSADGNGHATVSGDSDEDPSRQTVIDQYSSHHDSEGSEHNVATISSRRHADASLIPATYSTGEELGKSISFLKKSFEQHAECLDKLRCILEEVEFDFGDEEGNRKDVTNTLGCLCKLLQSPDANCDAFKALLIVLKATALHLSNVFKYSESDDIVLSVLKKFQRGNINEIKYLRLQFLTNLLSVHQLRNHLLALDTVLKTLVALTVSSILDGPGALIREAGCCLAYSLSIAKINEDHAFEISSALLHVVSDLERELKARNYCMAALKNFVRKSDQVAELARMIVPDLCSLELGI